MPPPPSSPTPKTNSNATPLADRIIAFGRMLRRAGLAVGSHQIMDALQAVGVVGVERRDDVYQALFSVFVQRRADTELFDQAFHLFWRAPSELSEVMQAMLPSAPGTKDEDQMRQRVAQALRGPGEPPGSPDRRSNSDEKEVEVFAAYSPTEVLKRKDFADFTAEEIAAAKEAIQHMHWPVAPRRVRRRSPREKGRLLDVRQTLRRSLRHHGELLHLHHRGPKRKRRPVVVLCDISGSMEPYARMLLHFLHAVSENMRRVESFVFGTRLTRITRELRKRDVDEALEEVSAVVNDWAGGTRIGEALRTFNYEWLRRVLRSSGVVLIISDGCDRGDTELLEREMARLDRNCHRLLWLNPLLRYEGYEPRTRGMQAVLSHIDDLLPVHNLESLEQLGQALTEVAHRPARRD